MAARAAANPSNGRQHRAETSSRGARPFTRNPIMPRRSARDTGRGPAPWSWICSVIPPRVALTE